VLPIVKLQRDKGQFENNDNNASQREWELRPRMAQIDTDKKHRKILLAMRLKGNYQYLYSLLFFFILLGAKLRKSFKNAKKWKEKITPTLYINKVYEGEWEAKC